MRLTNQSYLAAVIRSRLAKTPTAPLAMLVFKYMCPFQIHTKACSTIHTENRLFKRSSVIQPSAKHEVQRKSRDNSANIVYILHLTVNGYPRYIKNFTV